MKHGIVILLLIISGKIFAQNDKIAAVDAKSLEYYYASNWTGLESHIQQANNDGIDYPALDYRMGVAKYYQGKYKEARNSFNEYLEVYYEDAVAMEFVYYTFYYQGLYTKANIYLKDKSDYLKDKLKYHKPKALSGLYAEGSIKMANVDSIGNIPYWNIGLNYNFGHRLSLYHSFASLSQTSYWGNFKQWYHYIGANYYIGNNFNLNLAHSYSSLNIESNSLNRYRTPADTLSTLFVIPTYDYIIDYQSSQKNTINTFYFGLSKTIKRFNFSPYVSLFNSKNSNSASTKTSYQYVNVPDENEYTIDSTVSNSDTTIQQIQFGLNASFATWNQKFSIGINSGLLPNDSATHLIMKPWANYFITPKWSLKAGYLMNSSANIVEDNATIVNNAADITLNRMELMSTFFINKNVHLFLLYQNETRTDAINRSNYKFNTFLGGIKLNF